MKATTHLILPALLLGMTSLPTFAQQKEKEKEKETKIEIHVSKDGKSISRTYSSEEEMHNDKELKELMGNEAVIWIEKDKDIHVAGGHHKMVEVITDGDEKESVIVIAGGDGDGDMHTEHVEKKVIMVEKGDGKHVEVYTFSEDEEIPEELRNMVEKHEGLAVISMDRGKEVEVIKKVYKKDKKKSILRELDIKTDLKKNEIDLAFTGEAVPTTVRLTDSKGKELYKKTLMDFDGSFEETIKLKKFNGKMLELSIEQNGEVEVEKIILD